MAERKGTSSGLIEHVNDCFVFQSRFAAYKGYKYFIYKPLFKLTITQEVSAQPGVCTRHLTARPLLRDK